MAGFLKSVLAAFTALLLFVLFAAGVFSVVTAEVPVRVPAKAVLVVDLAVPIADKPQTSNPAAFAESVILGGPIESITLLEVLDAFRRAAGDDRIAAVFLHGAVSAPGLTSGWAALTEIRGELERFREAGKKIVAYGANMDERTYYLASAADEVWIHPAGLLELNGLCMERMFYAKAFEKYGIEVQVTRAGKYKSAVEPFTLDQMSPESREQAQELIADMFGVFLDAVAASRNIPLEELTALAASGGLLEGSAATAAGLADRTAYFDEVLAALEDLAGRSGEGPEATFNQIALADYARAEAPDGGGDGGDDRPPPSFYGAPDSANKIAVIYAEGEIVDGWSEAEAGGETIARLLRRARQDDEVKAVVLRVNSPGGSVTASEVILREMRLIAKEKPVVVSMGALAASGGYWIACCADEILAEPDTITGSIGVFGLFPSVKELMNDVGVTVDSAKTGPFADMMSFYRPMSPQELEIFQGLVDRVYDEFLDRVAKGRSLGRDTVHVIAQGRVWSGRDARELGLVDGLGGLCDAITIAARRADVGKDYSLTFYQRERDLLDDLVALFAGGGPDEIARSGGAPGGRGSAGAELLRICRGLRALDRLNDPRALYARLPFDPVVR